MLQTGAFQGGYVFQALAALQSSAEGVRLNKDESF